MKRHDCPSRYLRPGQEADEAKYAAHIERIIAARKERERPTQLSLLDEPA